MAGVDRIQSSRRELKYVISENQAVAVRDFVRSYLIPDQFLLGQPISGYPVCSLYLDSSALSLYGQTLTGQKNRFKLRIRFYDDFPDCPVYLEVKRRETVIVKKMRAAVTREGAQQVLAGTPASIEVLFDRQPTNKAVKALMEFCDLRDQLQARGCSYVYYRREAYVSPAANDTRVTFDRDLQGGVYQLGTPLALPYEVEQPEVGGVILELKFTGRFPSWMQELVWHFNLESVPVPKYVKCVDALKISTFGLNQVGRITHERMA